jgi:two-component system sensor histidine kinase GlrK
MSIILSMKKRGLLEKLIIAYAVFLVVLVGLTAMLVYVSSRLSSITTEIYLIDYQKKEISDKLIEDLISLEETGKQYLLLQKESYKALIEEKERDIVSAWAYLCDQDICYDDQERKVVSGGMQIWQGFIERFNAQIANLPDKTIDIEAVFLENSRDLDTLVGFARYVNARAIKSLDGKIVFLKGLGDQVMTFTWWALGIAISIGLIVPLIIYRSITNDLTSIRAGIKHIAQGDFSYKIPLDSTDELGMLADSFNNMAIRLKELDDMKSEFISIVSHELKTPLTSMKEAANLLMEGVGGDLDEKQKRLISIMEQGINRLLQTIGELLEMSKLESGIVQLQMEMHEINDIVAGFISEIKPYADTKGVNIHVRYLQKGCMVILDKNKILQVLTNLTHNAIKYSHEGSRVDVRIKNPDDYITVEIEDHGKGIPQEDIPLIFEKFYQSKTTRGHSGIGLGLAISKSIVDAHGGRIYAKSSVGKGSVFTFSLPLGPKSSAFGM